MILALRYEGDLSHEVAQALGGSVGTVKNCLHRAREALAWCSRRRSGGCREGSTARTRTVLDASPDLARRGPRRDAPRPCARASAATRPAAATPRGRLVDLVLRAAAVAAAFAAAMFVTPVSIEAAEFDAAPLVEWNARVAESVARHLPALDVPDAALADVDVTWPLAAAAALLVGAGFWFVRGRRRR
jgi:hypothetical protein